MTVTPDGTTSHKFAVVINKKVPPARAMNAIGHLLAALVSRADEDTRRQMMVVDYLDKNGIVHPVSALSLVVLQAKNTNHIRKARAEASGSNLAFSDFIESMTGGTYAEQMGRTALLGPEEIEYWGLAVFGPKPAVDRICGKFSLWRDAGPVEGTLTEPGSGSPETPE